MELIRGFILIVMASLFIFVFVVLIDDAIMRRTKDNIHKEIRFNRLLQYIRDKNEFKKQWREEYEEIKATKKRNNAKN